MKKLKFSSFTITTQIFLILILLVLPINLFCIIIARNSQNIVTKHAIESVQAAIDNRLDSLESKINESSSSLYTLLNDSRSLPFSRQSGGVEYLNAKFYVSNYLYSRMTFSEFSADVYFFYAPALDDLLVCKNRRFLFYRPDLYEHIQDRFLLSTLNSWEIFDFDENQWLVNVSRINQIYVGHMFCLDETINEIKNLLPYEQIEVYLSETPAERTKGSFTVSAESSTSYHFVVRLDESEVLGSLPIFERIAFAIALLSLLLLPVLFHNLKRILTRPLRKIDSAMMRLEEGDMDYRIGVHDYPREFVNINNTFNRMAENIQTLKIQKYEEQVEKERLYVRNLELQIRPHFLINTFNLMFSLSQVDDREHLENTILYLSDYFRHIFRNGQKLASFSIEIKLIQSYIEIAELRFPGEFVIKYDISEEALDFNVPPLLVHNFVENIMRHALVHGKTIHILLSAYRTEDNMGNIIIEDDGSGMPSDVAEKLNEGMVDAVSDIHVGLANSYQRIKFFLGEEASFHVDSEKGKGTKVTIRFPII